MPHCIIEYSTTLERQLSPAGLVAAVHQGASDSELFSEDDIKTRATGYEHHHTGTAKRDFVHVTARILSGRSQQQRYDLSHCILSALQALRLTNISLTVEVVEIARDSYAKRVG